MFTHVKALNVVTMLVVFQVESAYTAEIKKIQDNSFLVEEAYNQESGVVQHIQSFQYMKGGSWLYTFTQEWPVPGQTHQLSYSIPVQRTDGESHNAGLSDILINYRYQAALKERVAFSPRLSILLPTGDYKKGLGTGAVGYQTNLPLSVEIGDSLVTHLNLGWTFTPDSKNEVGAKANTLVTNYGASLIYLASETFNLMLEMAGNSGQTVNGNRTTKTESSVFVNPGARFAVNCKGGLQIVPGISFPIGLGSSHDEFGAFFYLSFEHPMF
ncbi:transporter [Geomonas paludis]|uniref:Transporter n=1 Tax=Geomonas paludis TaxID=2740185 RepID=A0ABY4LME8_9BACT|nr:transporter [Geomonas paludis]UPU37933.1 transporter [Geomonas paludis]